MSRWAVALLLMATGMFILAMVMPRFQIVPLLLAGFCLLLVATPFGQAGRLSTSLSAFRKRPVEIRVWGKPLDSRCSIESTLALGAGLHLFVSVGAGPPTHLKVAQPRGATVGESSVAIADAAYVQWRGHKLPRAAGVPALTIADA